MSKNDLIEALSNYKVLKITHEQLVDKLEGRNFNNGEIDEIILDSEELISVLQAAKEGRLPIPALVDWVNVIWFTEFYDFPEKQRDAIAAVLEELEELDEIDYQITPEQIDFYINALENNEDISEVRQVSWEERLKKKK